MVIKASLSRQIETLIAELASERPAAREGAIARLSVIGGRAIDRLTTLLAMREAAPSSRVAALRALEAIADPRTLKASLEAIDDPDVDVAEAAVRAARVFLRGPRGAAVVDRLTEVALNRARSGAVRLAAIRALSDLEFSTFQPLIEALKDDPIEGVRGLARRPESVVGELRDWEGRLQHAVDHGLPDDPVALRRAISQGAGAVSLPHLHRLIERIREREAADDATRQADWMATRAAAHVALASRGSRLALYDIREALEAASGPLPVGFLSALTAVGDVSCLEPIAAAFSRAAASAPTANDWWRRHLASAFQAIVARERITRRHRVVRTIERRWAGALRELWPGRPG